MKEFLFLYKADYANMSQNNPDQAESMMKKWMDWLGSIAAQNKLVSQGNRLQSSGKIVKSNNVVINGPYTDIKESIGGYSIIKADSYDEAVEFAKGSPILNAGGNVEIREIDAM